MFTSNAQSKYAASAAFAETTTIKKHGMHGSKEVVIKHHEGMGVTKKVIIKKHED
jgi:hypothetical protein